MREFKAEAADSGEWWDTFVRDGGGDSSCPYRGHIRLKRIHAKHARGVICMFRVVFHLTLSLHFFLCQDRYLLGIISSS